jgi:hypothetical protein
MRQMGDGMVVKPKETWNAQPFILDMLILNVIALCDNFLLRDCDKISSLFILETYN